MLKTQRQEKIIKLLEENNTMGVAELASALGFSMMTIRRDLEDLALNAVIKKVHGGAVLVRNDLVQPSFQERLMENSSEKTRIAIETVKRITAGSVVFFDSSTTTLSVVEHLPAQLEFTAITNCLMTALKLCDKPQVNVIMLGGEIHHSSYTAVNNIPIEQAARFNADLAIISTKAFSYPEGMFEAKLPLIEIKKQLVKCSKRVILLADYTKFESKSLCQSMRIEDIDEIITDSKAPVDILEKLKRDGIQVTIV